jgi:hypothetical protein
MLHDCLHAIALPELLWQRQEELDDKNFDIACLLHENRLANLTLEPVCCWLLDHLGFKHEQRKKGRHVDKHKKPETIARCRHFVKRFRELANAMFAGHSCCWQM